jgi:tRNA(Ile)-lysidine synthase TilS/MesJ
MQKILGYMRKAVIDYHMIEPGDKIAVGVSGGKDSVALLVGLCRLREFIGIDYEIHAITVDPVFDGKETDYEAVTALCESYGVTHHIRRSELGDIIFVQRKEKNPCSLCARMRRGMLHDMTKELACNKLALGHNYDDAVETFVMNLFHEGRVGCFQPVTYLSRKDLTMIRPLVFATEKDILSAVNRCQLPIVKSACPANGVTAREDTKRWLKEMERTTQPGLTKRLFGAIRRGHIDGW